MVRFYLDLMYTRISTVGGILSDFLQTTNDYFTFVSVSFYFNFTATDDCLDSPCQNNGSCSDGINTFSCACAVGFAGSNCNTNINDCEDNVCANGGTCVDGVDEYSCQCPGGFSGEFCEIKYGKMLM